MNHLMPSRKPFICYIILSSIVIMMTAIPVSAFYERETDKGSIDVRGMIRSYFSIIKNPENRFFYNGTNTSGIAGLARLIVQGKTSGNFGFELNAYQSLIPSSLISDQTSPRILQYVERSGIFDRGFSDRDYVHFSMDRLNIEYSFKKLDLIVGRQPINLATTFYFTPNDFFAPFAAQTFYRVYKPGVDALRANVQIGELSNQ